MDSTVSELTVIFFFTFDRTPWTEDQLMVSLYLKMITKDTRSAKEWRGHIHTTSGTGTHGLSV